MDRLAELRERRALTLRELAGMSGVAADTINQIELGHRKARPSTLRKLAKALDVEVRELFEEPAPLGEAPSPGPLSPERARKSDPDSFRQVIRGVPAEALQSLALDLVSGYLPQTFEDLAQKSPEEVYRRVVDFSRADIVSEELQRRGVRPVESYVLAMRRHRAAMSPPEARHDNQEGQEGQEVG